MLGCFGFIIKATVFLVFLALFIAFVVMFATYAIPVLVIIFLVWFFVMGVKFIFK